MRFNSHFELAGKHAYLSASKYHWINYSDEKLERTYKTAMMAARGTELHDLASNCIRLKVRMPRTTETINAYVNDAIGFMMTPEQVLFYSPNAFGTADAIGFRLNPETGRYMLRIHDLKTGVIPGSFHQLDIYAAFFCLEYGFLPAEIDIELRIYQNDDVSIMVGDFDEITRIMSRIKLFDEMINDARAEAFS